MKHWIIDRRKSRLSTDRLSSRQGQPLFYCQNIENLFTMKEFIIIFGFIDPDRGICCKMENVS